MSTFDFIPYIGLVTKADAKSKFSFYEYDTYSRLSVIKDQDNDVLNQYRYGNRNLASCPLFISNGITKTVYPKCPTNYVAQAVSLSILEGENYSIVSPADADNKADSVALFQLEDIMLLHKRRLIKWQLMI